LATAAERDFLACDLPRAGTPHGKLSSRARIGSPSVWIPSIGGEELDEAFRRIFIRREQIRQHG